MNVLQFPYQLTDHAKKVITDRDINLEWIERIMFSPRKVEADADDLELEHAIGEINEYGNRILRVIYNKTTDPRRIITVYFDRTLMI